ncbi:MAG: M1 family peptidase, partial [Flavobacteriia bacterium]|nr:M1 family peptidase [Flavobacteriia bacterium]
MKQIILALLVIFVLSACSTSTTLSNAEIIATVEDSLLYDNDFAMDTSFIFDDVGIIEESRKTYNASKNKRLDLVHTKIEARFNWKESTMNGKASITLKPHFYTIDSVELDAKGMEIIAISMNKKALSYDYYEAKKLIIQLGKAFKKDEPFTIDIEYVAKPEERILGGSSAISSDKGLFFINPKGELKDVMPQIWTQGETEANSVWFPTIDAPNSKSTQEIIMTVEDKYVTLSNGKLLSSKKNDDGTRTDHWKQDLPHAPYLFMMAVGEFKIVQDFYLRKDGKKIEVNYYVEPEFEKDAKSIFGKTPKMIKCFSEKLGVEYPWDKYSQIVVRDYVSGAMENTGAVVFGDFVYKTKRELIDGNDESTIAHELFHHWFGDLVTCESWANLPLNESFANYAQYLWDEYEYGRDEADYNAEDEASGYYSSKTYKNLIRYDYADKEDMFDSHSYNKGGRILHMLRNYLGDEAFFAGLNRYLTVNSYKSAEIHDLRLAMEEVSGEDLNWFFDQWFLSNGHPVLFTEQSIDKVNKTVTISVKQAQSFPAFKLPINVALWDEDGKHIYPIVIENLDESFTFPYIGTVKNVHLDDD